MTAVLKHELKNSFGSLTTYVFGAFLLAFIGLGALDYNINSAVSNFEYVLYYGCLILVVIVPILTMRVIAEERRQRTDQLLYSLPITTLDVVIGKYIALLAQFILPLAVICVYPLIFAHYGEVYLPTVYGSILAFFIMGAALTAIGMFISSLTENQGMAAGIGVAVMLFNYYSVTLSEYVSTSAYSALVAIVVIILLLGALVRHVTGSENLAWWLCIALIACTALLYFADSEALEGLLPDLMRNLSLFERFYVFVNGVFDMTAIVYYISVIVFFLFLTVQSLEKRRYN